MNKHKSNCFERDAISTLSPVHILIVPLCPPPYSKPPIPVQLRENNRPFRLLRTTVRLSIPSSGSISQLWHLFRKSP